MASKSVLPVRLLLQQLIHAKPTSRAAQHNFSWLRNVCGTTHSTLKVPIYQPRFYGSEKQQQQETAVDGAAASSGADVMNDVEQLKVEIEKLNIDLTAEKEKNGDLLDKYKRALADSENMRVRLNKQINDAKVFGIQSFCKDLLEVADTLGHATAAVPKDKLNNNLDLKNLYEGLNMTRASLLQVFKRHGLEPLDPINQKFDPNFHEALFQKEDNSVEANTIIEVNKLGYKLHERCIRPALVGVSKC